MIEFQLPNIAFGARFWSYHLKPADAYDYFIADSLLAGTDLWTEDTLYFQPTQVAISVEVITTPSADQTLTLEITGKDQFGFPVEEPWTFTTSETGISHIGTMKCYSSIESIIVAENGFDPAADKYSIGIGVSAVASGESPQTDIINQSYRIPTPARIRDSEQVKAVHDVFESTIYLRILDSPTNAEPLTVDPENQALEIVIATSTTDSNFAVIMDPNTTSI